MGFLTPFMLLGILAAGIPVAIHLFFRSRYKTVPWAAMKFLLTSVEQTSRRLRFQELLLLLLRMLILILLAFAFARPISSVTRGVGRGEAVDAVFVFDLSFSMGANDGEKTRFERAKEEAVKIIEQLPPHSTVQIVTSAGKTTALVGPRSPGNLDQAKQLVNELELTHLATDLSGGLAEAKVILQSGGASNKELYVFSDMQKLGFEADADKLRSTLTEIEEKAVVHLVRCGTRTLKNAAIERITPQAGVPRPNDHADFAVVVRNTGSEAMNNVGVSLIIDGDEKNAISTQIDKLPRGESRAVTLGGKLTKAGLRTLTAKIVNDDVPGDNRFDQVILVRDQINILVVDGNYHEREPEKSSSYYLMHSLVPVKESERATYKYNPRVVSARLASQGSEALLKDQHICVLVNCSLQAKLGLRAETLTNDFVQALDTFVRSGHGLIVFAGDNVQPDAYNKILGAKHGLLPMPIKPAIKSEKMPFFMSRESFGSAPPAFWKFREDKYYEVFDAVPVWKHLELDDSGVPLKGEEPKEKEGENAESHPVQTIVKLNSDKVLAASKKVGTGGVIFVGTAAQQEGQDPDSGIPNWTIFNKLPPYLYFLEASLAHLMNTQTQTYNLTAGETLKWHLTDKQHQMYSLIHPGDTVARLGVPEKTSKGQFVVTANDLSRSGVYRLFSQPRGGEGNDIFDLREVTKNAQPIAVTPDPRESADLTSLSNEQLNDRLGFVPIHIIAGAEEGSSTGAERMNREWTVWVLLAVLILALCEVAFAWWCGRSW